MMKLIFKFNLLNVYQLMHAKTLAIRYRVVIFDNFELTKTELNILNVYKNRLLV